MDSRDPREDHELAACPNPWCESHERPERGYTPFITSSRASFEMAVACPVCPMRGPWCDSNAEAIAAWNRRPSPVAESTPSPDTEGVGLAKELERLHNDARGCEFDLVPADGPIARLALFMHENGDQLAALLRTAQNTGRDEVLEEAEVERIARSFASWAHQTTGKWKSDGSPPPTWDQIARIYQDYYCEIVRRVYAALSSPPVSTVDEEGGGA